MGRSARLYLRLWASASSFCQMTSKRPLRHKGDIGQLGCRPPGMAHAPRGPTWAHATSVASLPCASYKKQERGQNALQGADHGKPAGITAILPWRKRRPVALTPRAPPHAKMRGAQGTVPALAALSTNDPARDRPCTRICARRRLRHRGSWRATRGSGSARLRASACDAPAGPYVPRQAP